MKKCPVCNSQRIRTNGKDTQCKNCGYTHQKVGKGTVGLANQETNRNVSRHDAREGLHSEVTHW